MQLLCLLAFHISSPPHLYIEHLHFVLEGAVLSLQSAVVISQPLQLEGREGGREGGRGGGRG